MSISLSAAPPPTPVQGVPPSSSPPQGPSEATTAILGPAATVSLSNSQPAPAAEPGRFVRDEASRSLVFQVVDPATGDITVQIPSEVVLKARTYARATAEGEAVPGRTVARQA